MVFKDWYQRDQTLIDELRDLHRSAVPLPAIVGYDELSFLQRGGQGSVFLARELKSSRWVALKVFHAGPFETPSARRRFEREIELVARLGHPNVVRLYRFGRTRGGQSFLTMEYVRGKPWSEFVPTASTGELLGLGLQIASALEHAHRHGVIHRDLKPGNVIVDEAGNARLIDFGMAKPLRRIRQRDGWELSASGQFLGTLRWASPEQLRGHQDDVDTRTDIYCLGLLLYEALAGCMPYALDGSVADIASSIEQQAPTPLRKHRPEVSVDLETLLMRCLAKQASRRYASMADLSRDLAHVQAGEPIEARRDGLGYVLRSLCKQHPLGSAGLALGVLGLSLFAGISSHYYLRAKDSEAKLRLALEQEQKEVNKVAAVNEFLLGAFLGQGVAPEELGDLSLRDVLSEGADQIELKPTLRDQPAVRADLHVAYAFWFAAMPEHAAQAQEHISRALALYAEQQSPCETQRAWALEVRAGLAMNQGRFEAAEKDLQASLGLYGQAEVDEFNRARILGQLASCGFARQELAAAESYLLECRDILLRKFGPEAAQVKAIDDALTHAQRLMAE